MAIANERRRSWPKQSWARWSPWTGFTADNNDEVGPLFDWYGNGDVTWAFEGADYECRTTQASGDFVQSHYRDSAAVVIGRRLFDLTNGWNGKPAAGEHVFVVTHRPPTDWEHAATAPFTFVDGVEGHCRRQGVRRRPGRRPGRRSDRQPGARARADRPGGRQPGPGGLQREEIAVGDRETGTVFGPPRARLLQHERQPLVLR